MSRESSGGAGLEARYHVQKINDPNGKHDECRYFVLDPAHDLIARQALAFYRNHAARLGYDALANDLTAWLDALDPASVGRGCADCPSRPAPCAICPRGEDR